MTVAWSNFAGGTGANAIGTIDLTGGTVNAAIDALTLGLVSANQVNVGTQTNGTFIFTAGSVNVNSLLVGVTAATNTNSAAIGAFGTATIGGGTLTVNNTFALGVNQGGATAPSGTFNLNGGVVVAGCPIQGGGGTSTFNFNGGTLMAGTSSTTFMQGLTGANVGNSGAFINPNGNNITIAQPLQSSGGSIGGVTESGPGVLTLAGSSTYVGPTTINGVVNATFLANVNTPSPLGLGSAGGSPADLVINGGTLQYTGSVPTSTNRVFTVGANGATLDASGNANGSMTVGSGGGAIAFANTAAPATLTLTGNGTGNAAGILAATVGDSNPGNFATTLVKTGTGQWNLSAANTFTGPVNVNAGGLYVNGSLLASGTVNVAAGAALGGTGSAGNTFASPGGGIDVSANGTTTLTLTSLNFSGNGTINMPAFMNTGSVALQAGSLTPGGAAGSVQINFPNVAVPNGTYRLIGYGSIGGSGFSAFSVGQSGSLGARQTTALLDNPGEIDYQVNGQTPFWNASQTDWQAMNAWTLQPSNVQATFITGDNDNFTDSAGSGAIAVTISQGNVAPISVTINNNAASYSFGGAYGIIDGSSPTYLVKSGTGSLTIANTNGYSGGTTFNAGLVTLNSPMALGTGSLGVNGGTLNANFAQSVSAVAIGAAVLNANSIGALGSGPLTINGGTLSANFAQTVSSVTFNGGLLNINDPSAIGGGLLTIAGGTLDNTSGTAVALVTSNPQNWNSDIVFNGTSSLDMGSGTVALGASRVVTVLGSNLSVGGVSGAGFSLTKAGSGTLTLTGANTYNSGTLVLAGLLQVTGGSNSLSTGGSITTAGGTLDLGSLGQSTSGLISFQGGGAQNGTLTETALTAFDAQSGVINAVLAGNVGLNKTTTGTIVLGASNLYTGKTTIGAGLLQLSAPNGYMPPASAITITGGTLDLGTQSQSTSGVVTFQGGVVQNGTLTESNTANAFAAQSGTVTAILAGSVSLNKTTTGSVLLGANNLYTGNTTVSAGLLQMAGTNVYAGTTTVSGGSLQLLATNALPATTSLVFSGSPTVDLAGTTSQTIAGLTATAAGASVIQNIGSGQTMNIVSGSTGAVVNMGNLASQINVSIAMTGSGTLALTATNGSFQMNSGGTAGQVTTLNLSGLSNFNANVSEFDVGINPAATGANGESLLLLAANNAITAQNLFVGKGPNNQGGTFAILDLGASNTFNVGNFYVGTGKQGGGGATPSVVTFNGQPGTLTIAGSSGPGSRANVTLGWYNVNATGNTPVGTIDLTGGTVNASIDSLTLGLGDAANINNQTPTGTFIFNAGTVDVNNLIAGETTALSTSAVGQPRGIFTIGGGTLTVNSSFMLAEKIGSATPVGTFNLNGGVALVNCDIQGGGGTSFFIFNGGKLVSGSSSTTFMQNLSVAFVNNGGAIIDTAGNTVTINQNLLQNGSGGLTKLGAGMLTLGGVNTYVGGTTVSGGTLQLALANPSGFSAPTGPLTINGATLDLNGNSPTVGALSGTAGALITDSNITSGTLTVGQSSTTTYGGSIDNGPNSPATTVGLLLTGSGTLFLSGTNTYGGGTAVENGTLIATNPSALADGSNLFVGAAGSFFAPVVPAAQIPASSTSAVSPVPEPGTLALLAAGAVAMAGTLRRKKRNGPII